MFSPCHIKQNQNVNKCMQGLSFDNIVLKELHTNIDRKYQKKNENCQRNGKSQQYLKRDMLELDLKVLAQFVSFQKH